MAAALIFMISCSDSIVVNNPSPVSYNEIVSVDIGEVNIKLFITGNDSLTLGYNDIFMKVKKGNAVQTKGYVKFFPKMWMTPTFLHSTAVSEKFLYDAGTGYYKGYAIFNMVTGPPDVIWYGVFTYVDENSNSFISDSVPMYTKYDSTKQWRLIYDQSEQCNYTISLVKPFKVVPGMNDIQLLLHKTDFQLLNFEQIDNAVMSISVYKLDSTYIQSTGNVNPVSSPDGVYRGKFNLPHKGGWQLCDSIYYDNKWITNNPPPMPQFFFEIN